MIRIRLRTRLLVSLAALALLGAACGDDGNDTGVGATGDLTGPAVSAPTGSTENGGYYGGGGGMGGSDDDGSGDDKGSTAATVTTNNFSFDPEEFEVASGSEITVKNGNANTPHTFTIPGTDVDAEVGPLESEDATIDLDPGTYDFICKFHEAQGMVGTLTVT